MILPKYIEGYSPFSGKYVQEADLSGQFFVSLIGEPKASPGGSLGGTKKRSFFEK